ncbi:MAG TPA: hypothetical protein VK072_04430 [Candidatus Avamphibacillus sp.]|nr:hypothetical protein [Candidatus Avamphibacillus sp.]
MHKSLDKCKEESVLDRDWLRLIEKAKDLGLSKGEVRFILKKLEK